MRLNTATPISRTRTRPSKCPMEVMLLAGMDLDPTHNLTLPVPPVLMAALPGLTDSLCRVARPCPGLL